MRAALYCRVSTDEQAREGVSLAAQQQALMAYCQSQGWTVADIYVDDGYSAATLERPALRRLLADVAARRLDVVLVHRLDRLSRRQRDVLHLVEDEFGRRGVGFRSATESFDTTTPAGKAMVGMLSVFAQLERETIVERVRIAMAQLPAQGRWKGGPVHMAYRYDAERRLLVPDPQGAALYLRIVAMYERGDGLDRIAWALAREGLPSPWGGRWTAATVRRLLSSPTPAGYLGHNGALHAGPHEAVIAPERWRALQDEAARRKEANYRGRRDWFLLSGLLVCGVCGHRLRGRRTWPLRAGVAKSYRYYYCPSRLGTERRRRPEGPCGLPSVRCEALDAAVLATLRRYALDPSALAEALAAVAVGPTETRRPDGRRRLREIEAAIARYQEGFESGALPPDAFAGRVGALMAERERLAAEPKAPPGSARIAPRQVAGRLRAALRGLEGADVTQQQAVLRTVIERVTVGAEGVEVRLRPEALSSS